MIPNLTITQYEIHPLASIFPIMTDDELHKLRDDIIAHGQREPIKLFDDRILDGRNRYFACLAAGIEPIVETIDTKYPQQYVVSQNLHRRHLTESQRAIIADKLSNTQICVNGQKLTQAEAAQIMAVSTRLVTSAKTVRENASPEINEAVIGGQLAVSAAAKMVTSGQTQFATPTQPLNISGGQSKKTTPTHPDEKIPVITYYNLSEIAHAMIEAKKADTTVDHFLKIKSLAGYKGTIEYFGLGDKRTPLTRTKDEVRAIRQAKKDLREFNQAADLSFNKKQAAKALQEDDDIRAMIGRNASASAQADANSPSHSTP